MGLWKYERYDGKFIQIFLILSHFLSMNYFDFFVMSLNYREFAARISFITFFWENYFLLVVENKVLEAGRIYLITSKKTTFQLRGFFTFFLHFLHQLQFERIYICYQFSVQKYTKLTSPFYISIPMCSAGGKH